ncbi:MAG: hypothetical protein A2W93_14405 [Bacteroidetes bacterium GWF2_43_63]|nr:MAG: hypothetical protein A2W94_00975 [Bacteroidetes bacterium GWE2_42_42]OFY52532.1 MAG: hypothetical protein A2W93_14405 [Bacteroidetes bacterium GWF2_43_63]HBG71440.1 hypothetical protein [Bacteroidales bacterium]HCB60808.1 hypothetical protein [Bacteroidales bacterium]HCY23467.1 hypothetical protein [Bacteroidales bacterium]
MKTQNKTTGINADIALGNIKDVCARGDGNNITSKYLMTYFKVCDLQRNNIIVDKSRITKVDGGVWFCFGNKRIKAYGGAHIHAFENCKVVLYAGAQCTPHLQLKVNAETPQSK